MKALFQRSLRGFESLSNVLHESHDYYTQEILRYRDSGELGYDLRHMIEYESRYTSTKSYPLRSIAYRYQKGTFSFKRQRRIFEFQAAIKAD